MSIISAFAVAYAILSQIRFEGFFATNWDLGLNMQMLWTNTHGYLLYEAGDFEVARANSFLFIHPTFVAIPVSWFYVLAPTATTLFAFQAAAVASSALPLYFIGRRAEVPERVLFASIAIYLLSFTILSALLYDFHWECLIPAEFLWTYYLWARGRYWLALIPVVAGMLTLEVFPVLLVGIVVYFGYPFLASLARAPRDALAKLRNDPRRAAPLAGLLTIAVAGHLALVYFVGNVLSNITGLSPIYPLASPRTFLGIYVWGLSASNVGPRLTYWLLLVGGFGFLPLVVRQRLLILSLPWFLYSVAMVPYAGYTQFGYQYGFIAVAPLAISFVESFGPLGLFSANSAPRPALATARWLVLIIPFLVASLVDSLSLLEEGSAGIEVGVVVGLVTLGGFLAFHLASRLLPPDRSVGPATPPRRGRASVWRSPVAVALIAALVVTNVAMSPLNPANYRGPGLGGYSFTYSSNPAYGEMASLVGKIAPGRTVLASTNLFPFVANNPKAYSLLWYPGTPEYLPFNSSELPDYVLLSSSEWFAVPAYLNDVLFLPGEYGLVEIVYASAAYPGSVYLFERGFTGSSDIVEVNPFPTEMTFCGSDLSLGASGGIVPLAATACGVVIQSQPQSGLSGNNATIWYGPYVNLLAGAYTVTLTLRGGFSAPGGPSNPPILYIDASAIGTDSWYSDVIYADQLSLTSWTTFTFHFDLSEPHPNAEWRGYLQGATVGGRYVPSFVQLNDIEVQYSA